MNGRHPVVGFKLRPQTFNKDEWRTPPELFNKLDDIFHFTLDAAATSENALCPKWFDRARNGLLQNWSGHIVWCNPPYSDLERWLRKMVEESRRPSWPTIVALIPASVGNQYWTDWVELCSLVCFVRKRVKFLYPGKNSNAPFWSALVIFNFNFRQHKSIHKLAEIGSLWLPARYGGE